MDRLLRVASLWSWLPAFRAVAETQHLPTASEHLQISASALSRTIRLLESDLGDPLFERQGRRIVLNEAGERLLVAVRDAMRRVHDGMSQIDTASLQGRVRVGSANAVADTVLDAVLGTLASAHPELIPHAVVATEAVLAEQLLQGQLDVAFTTAPLVNSSLARVRVGEVKCGVFARPDHPALRRETGFDPHADAFALWGMHADGRTHDGWPDAAPRAVQAIVHKPELALGLALQRRVLVVLPEALARPHLATGALMTVPTELIQPVTVFAYHRHSLLQHGRAETLVALACSAVTGGL